MLIPQAAPSLLNVDAVAWRADWLWSLPLIALTVIIHVLGLGLMHQRVVRIASGLTDRRHSTAIFAAIMGVTTVLATTLHGVEAAIWAFAYRLLGALPDRRSAMLYSLSAMTSYGHADINLEQHWKLMGAIEALSGWLLFGLTTAFLFAIIQKIWLLDRRDAPESSS